MARHPNQDEIDKLHAALVGLTEVEMYRLADVWTNGTPHRIARHRALHPDTPGVPEALRILLALPVLAPTGIPERVRGRALNALADAFTAAYGRPRLPPSQYHALMEPYWYAIALT